MGSKYERKPMIKYTRNCDMKSERSYYGSETCSCCKKKFELKPFERNIFTWGMRHTETITYDHDNYICPECKRQMNLFITKVLMDKKKWEVKE